MFRAVTGALSRTLALSAKAVLVIGLLCAVLLVQAGYAQPAPIACMMGNATSTIDDSAPQASCQHCCTVRACCLLSKSEKDTAPRPEPLGTERTQQIDHALTPVVLTLVFTFDFLAPPPLHSVAGAIDQVSRLVVVEPQRGALSCIWLI